MLLMPKVHVGRYQIQPVQASGAKGGAALNEWLSQNGFAKVALRQLDYFVKRKFTFLCVKAKLPTSMREGELKPLRSSFPTQQPYYPLRFSSHQGAFVLKLYLLSSQKLDPLASYDAIINKLKVAQKVPPEQLAKWVKEGWVRGTLLNRKMGWKELLPSVQKLLVAKADNETQQALRALSWYGSSFYSRRVNEKQAITSWRDDLSFKMKPLASNNTTPSSDAPLMLSKKGKAPTKRPINTNVAVADVSHLTKGSFWRRNMIWIGVFLAAALFLLINSFRKQ